MRVDRAVVEVRLDRIVYELDGISASLPPSQREFADPANEQLRYSLEHRLFIALTATLDIATHLASASDVQVDSYASAVMSLVGLGVFDHDLAERLVAATGMRNILAHEYEDVDFGRLYRALRSDLLEEFARSVWAWIEGAR